MKARHAAALALVGWYLMVPPFTELPPPSSDPPPFDVNFKAPLSEWDISKSFDKAEDCERLRKEVQTKEQSFAYPANMSKLNIVASRLAYLAARASAQCIATDDPRLKGGGK